MPPLKRLSILVVYHNKDESLKEDFDGHATGSFDHTGVPYVINYVHNISPNKKIKQNIKEANLVLFLTGPHMNSNAATKAIVEKVMMRRQTIGSDKLRVIPILVRPFAGIEKTAYGPLGSLPRDGKFITTRLANEIDTAWMETVSGIVQVFRVVAKEL
jgi:hypothetical protein